MTVAMRAGVASALEVRVQLMGQPRVRVRTRSGTHLTLLERRTAACLALLALAGPTSRARLGELLWPDGGEARARSNLRQLVRRSRLAAGAELMTGREHLAIAAGVSVDASAMATAAAPAEHPAWVAAAAAEGPLLGNFQLDDCSDLDDWLQVTRARLDWTRLHALDARSARLGVARPEAAVPLLLRWLSIDPASEEACRRLMHIHLRRGERAAALAVFDGCTRALRALLDADPDARTVALARAAGARCVVAERRPPPRSTRSA